MNLREFAEKVDIPEREIRYAISLGIIPTSASRGRRADGFGDDHVEAAERYKAFLSTGLSAREIADLDPTLPAPRILLQQSGLELRLMAGTTIEVLDSDTLNRFFSDARKAVAAKRAKAERQPENSEV